MPLDRNVESHFAENPTDLELPRSKFHTPHRHLTSFNAGRLVPILLKEIYPGDTMQLDTSKVVRLQTPITPFFDQLYLDIYYFFVPLRLCWSHAKQFFGENTESAWYPTTEYTIPQITAPEGGFAENTIADYFGIPTKVEGISVSALPFRAYALICNEWFRSTWVTDPLVIPNGDANQTGSNGDNYLTDVANGGMPFRVSRYRDYFSSCLPSPQAGPDVSIPVAQAGNLPVMTLSENHGFSGYNLTLRGSAYQNNQSAIYPGFGQFGFTPSNYNSIIGSNTNNAGFVSSEFNPVLYDSTHQGAEPLNLWAIQSGTAPAATINELRTAFQIQRWYEKSARSGQRYIEEIRAFFGVTSPDARMQRPEYLGGNRISLNVMQVNQSSATAADSTPLGTPGAMSLTSDTHSDFTHSFVEHGYVLGLACVRRDHTYQNGIERHWKRMDKFDYYWPTFANLNEMAVKNSEIYASGTSTDDEVFGYQEAWADLRYGVSMCSAEMRSNAQASLDVWHLADDYSDTPALSDEWIREDSDTVDRVLAVTSAAANQIYGDFYFDEYMTRVLPMYSIPGLIDHH